MESEARRKRIKYLEQNGSSIHMPRALQLRLQPSLPSDITTLTELTEIGPEIYKYVETVMPWDHNPEVLEELQSSQSQVQSEIIIQGRFYLIEDGKSVIGPRRLVSRDNFGPGNAGDRAFNIMLYGDGCERIIDFETKEMCGKPPASVLDYDVAGDLEQRLICGEGCALSAMEAIQNDLSSIGRNTIFGINGFGRA